MKRTYTKYDYDAYCENVRTDIVKSKGDDDDANDNVLTLDSVTLTTGSFRSVAATIKTLAKLYILTSEKRAVAFDMKIMPTAVLWPMILACLPGGRFYVEGSVVANQIMSIFDEMDLVIDVEVATIRDTNMVRITPNMVPGGLVFDHDYAIPDYIKDVMYQPPNRNNHVNKRVDPDKVYATNIIVPYTLITLMDNFCLPADECTNVQPYILANPAFLAEFEYDGPRTLGDIDDDCRYAVDFIGHSITRCIVVAYLYEDCEISGYPLLMMHTWMNACLGRYSGKEPSFEKFDVDVNMHPRGPDMAKESDITAWMVDTLDECAIELSTIFVLKPFLEKFMPDYGESETSIGDAFDEFMSSPTCIRTFLGETVNAAAALLKLGVFKNVDGLAENLADGYMSIGVGEVFVTAYNDSAKKDPFFLRLFEVLPQYSFPIANYVKIAIAKQIKAISEDADVDNLRNPTRCLMTHLQTKIISANVLRQTVELRPEILLSTPDVSNLPFIVQGESFVLPYHSISASPVIRSLSQMATVHLASFAVGTKPQYVFHRDRYEFVDLPPHVFLYNEGRRQHDYMPFMESWNNTTTNSAPTVFTAIINMSSREMVFHKTFAGRAVCGVGSPEYKHTNRPVGASTPEDTVRILPGYLYMYERVKCVKDRSNRPLAFQARLSRLEDSFDPEDFATPAEREHATTEGLMYVQVSIAVYKRRNMTTKTRTALEDQQLMSMIGGLSQSSLYHGKQASTNGDEGFIDDHKKPKRYPFPQLYNQLTNSHRSDTRPRFVGNYMMQRPEIIKWFFQDVAIISNDTAENEGDRVKIIIPRNGVNYDVQRHAFDVDIQAMSFKKLRRSGKYQEAFRKTDNNSTYTTREELNAAKVEPERLTKIYPSILPSLANLRGLPGLTSKRDKFNISSKLI